MKIYSLQEVVILTANSHKLQVKEVLWQEDTRDWREVAILVDCEKKRETRWRSLSVSKFKYNKFFPSPWLLDMIMINQFYYFFIIYSHESLPKRGSSNSLDFTVNASSNIPYDIRSETNSYLHVITSFAYTRREIKQIHSHEESILKPYRHYPNHQ